MSPPKVLMAAALLLALAAGGLAVALAHRASPPPAGAAEAGGEAVKPLEMTPAVAAVVKSNSEFALGLYGRLRADHAGKNLFFSPYSVSSALAMVAEGARGETAEQMGKALRFPAAARRGGDDAKLLPWDMAQVHTGMAALNDHFRAGSRGAPRAVREKIEALRRDLQAANQSAAEAGRAGKFAEQAKAARQSQALEKYVGRPEVARRFVEEAQIGGQLQHPGVVPVYDIGRFGARPFFTMKLLKGQTLAALPGERADPAADRPRFLGIALQVAQTLQEEGRCVASC